MENTLDYQGDRPHSGAISYLSCLSLKDHPLRMSFYEEMHLQKLTEAIRNDGLLQPIIVYPQKSQQFQILSGHYRIRAIRRLRQSSAPCIVFEGNTMDALRIHCTSNTLTRKINPIEEAHIIAELIRSEKMKMDEIGDFLGYSKSWVSRRFKLLKALDSKIRKLVETGEIQPRFAQELARLPQGNEQQRVWSLIKKQQMTKDDASSFVSWWITATEAERAEVEATPNAEPPLRELVQYAATSMKKCCIILDDLMLIAKQNSFSTEMWPTKEWSRLLSGVQDLTTIMVKKEKEAKNAT